ncbi:uncharacterized protein EV154DRAFT_599647 [Mucor mucedo]|uniref:uncharacterized protein n=1 Tax=Mucor mucedo TaxID=29922 RepID=UPI0022206E56|nr:uncharacterized protein EV154DRAFT_599647 [Mucor mucedo]KAI7894818.1 hypothetical protein EV154DRAFT_599647 [Mucor mucedo]
MANDMQPNTMPAKSTQQVARINPDNNVGNQSIQISTDSNEQDKVLHKKDFRYMNNDDSNSVMSHDEDDQSIDSGKKLGRKPIGEEDDDPELEEHQIKRKAQNRAAQRAFRERKELYVKELENKIRQVQNSHHHATTQLYQENQQLRFIIYRLELEISNLKGTTIDNRSESCLLSVGPPPDLKAFLPSPPPKFSSLIPLQIRPSSVEGTLKIIPNASPEKKRKKPDHHEESSNTATKKTEAKKTLSRKSNSASSKPAPSNASSQQFTFSITTPATLRATSNNESARKSEQIEAVQLYPDHSHPANYLLERNHRRPKTDMTPALSPTNFSSNDSVISSSSEEDDKTSHNKTKEFTDVLLDIVDDFDFSEFTSEDISAPDLAFNSLLESPSDQSWETY